MAVTPLAQTIAAAHVSSHLEPERLISPVTQVTPVKVNCKSLCASV